MHLDAQPLALLDEEGRVELRVVRRERRAADELEQLRDFRLCGTRIGDHGVGDAGELDHLFGDRLLRIDEAGVFLDDLPVADADRADLHDAVLARVEAGRLKVHDDDLVGQRALVRVGDDGRHVGQIGLDARDELDLVLLGRAERLRERLHDAVVRDRDGGMPPLRRALDEVAGGGHAVHLAHVGVHVQLDALALGGILALGLLARVDVQNHHDKALFKAVHLHVAAHGKPLARLHGVDDVADSLLLLLRRRALVVLRTRAEAALSRLVAKERLALDGVGIVGEREDQQLHLAALELARLRREHLAANNDLTGLLGQLGDLHGLRRDRPAKDRLGLFLRRLLLASDDLLLLLLDHLGDGLLVLLLSSAADLLELLFAQLDRLEDDVHVRHKHVFDQLLDIRVHAGLREKLRRDVLRHEDGEHVALAFKLRVLHERRAGGMAAPDAAQDKRRILHGIGKKVLRQLRGLDDQRHMHRGKVAPQRPLQRQKWPFLHEDIAGKIDGDLLAAAAGRHAVQRQMAPEIGRRAFQQAFPLFRHDFSPVP